MKFDREKWKEEFKRKQELSKKIIEENLDKDLLDDDGYPTIAAIEIIKHWSYEDLRGWFGLIKSIWYLNSWGWSEGEEAHDYDKDRKVYRYHISTAGWSGNESLIHAMKENEYMCWSLTWVQSRRGGHYIFELPAEDNL